MIRLKFNLFQNDGYTILELVIVIGIVASLFSLAVLGFRGSREREELISAQRQLIGDLKSAQSKAIAGVNGAGYGVKYVEPDPGSLRNSYKIVAYRYDQTGAACTDPPPAGLGGVEHPNWTLDCPGGASSCTVCKVDLKTVSFAQFTEKVQFEVGTEFNVYFYRTPDTGRGRLLFPDDSPFPDTGGETIQVIIKHDNLETVAVRIDTSGSIAQIEPMESPVPSPT